jgi:hypothetical protein
MVVLVVVAAIVPPSLPAPPRWAYAIMLPIYLVSFVAGVRYKNLRPPADDAPRRLSPWMYVIGGLTPAVVMVVGAVLRPSGPMVGYAINAMACFVMFVLGEVFAVRNRVPAGFRPWMSGS